MPINPDLLKAIEENDASIDTIHITDTYPPLNFNDINTLVKAARKNTYLKRLLFDENDIGDEGAELLSQLINIEELALGSNKITDKGALALSRMPNLKELSITSNQISNTGFAALLNNPTLKTLIVLDNPITNEGAKLALNNFRLTTLMLDEESIDKSLLEKINNHIESNEIGNNSNSEEDLEKYFEECDSNFKQEGTLHPQASNGYSFSKFIELPQNMQELLISSLLEDGKNAEIIYSTLSQSNLISKELATLLTETANNHKEKLNYWALNGGIKAISYLGKYFNKDLADFLITRAEMWPNNKLECVNALQYLHNSLTKEIQNNTIINKDINSALEAYNTCVSNKIFKGLDLYPINITREDLNTKSTNTAFFKDDTSKVKGNTTLSESLTYKLKI